MFLRSDFISRAGLPALFLFLLLLNNGLGARNHPGLPGDQATVIDSLFLAWDTAWTPGVAVAVVKHGGIAYANGYGFANMEYDIPVTPSTVFHIASISKQFTTFSVLLLEADGKLSLDDEIQKHIPELPDFGVPVTLRHLAHNTSGMRDQWNLLGMAGWRLDDVITTQQVLRLLSRQKELNFQPGEEYLYSNSGFTLLAEVVARVSGQSFAEFTKERIFEPLGMTSTLFYDDHEKIVRNRAYSYGFRNGHYQKRVLSYATAGATSLFTTVEDLSLWALNFDNPVVGDAAIIEKMNTRGVLNDGTQIAYALGQNVGAYRDIPMISHGGADAGFRTFLARFPEQGMAVIVFSNDAAFSSSPMAMRVADIVLEEYFADEPDDEKENQPEAGASGEDAFDPTSIDLLRYTGIYYSEELDITYVLDLRNDDSGIPGLVASQLRVGEIRLTPTAPETFRGSMWFAARVVFETDEAGTVTGLRMSGSRARNLWFEKM
jgi:CubicO group peptidase (beta-lactamase class C family)